MARRVQGKGLQRADGVAVAILEQRVELRSVTLELGPLVEDLPEGLLHDGNLLTDADLSAQLGLDIGCRGQVISVDMGLDQPFQTPAPRLDEGDDLVGMVIGDPARRIVDIHDGIDHRAGVRAGVAQDIADRVGGGIEKAVNFGMNGRLCSGHGSFPLAWGRSCGRQSAARPRLWCQSILVVKYQSTVFSPSCMRASAASQVCGVGTMTGWPGCQFSGVATLCSADVWRATIRR